MSQSPAKKIRAVQDPDQPMIDDQQFEELVGPFDAYQEIFNPLSPQLPAQHRDASEVPIPEEDDLHVGEHPSSQPPSETPAPVGMSASFSENNCLLAYSDHLQIESSKHRRYTPSFVLQNSNQVAKAHRRRWKDTVVEIETGGLPTTPKPSRNALNFMITLPT